MAIVINLDEIMKKRGVGLTELSDRVGITLANLSYDTAADISLDFLGGHVTGDASVRLLAGENANSHNTFETPEAVTPTEFSIDPTKTITLPAASVMAIRVAVE